MAWTNRGKTRMFEMFFEASGYQGPQGDFALAACTAATEPDANTFAFSSLTQVAASGGYSAMPVERGGAASGFLITEGDEFALATLTGNYVLTANASESIANIKYFVLTDKNSTEAERELFAYWSIDTPLTISDGATLTVSATLQGT